MLVIPVFCQSHVGMHVNEPWNMRTTFPVEDIKTSIMASSEEHLLSTCFACDCLTSPRAVNAAFVSPELTMMQRENLINKLDMRQDYYYYFKKKTFLRTAQVVKLSHKNRGHQLTRPHSSSSK